MLVAVDELQIIRNQYKEVLGIYQKIKGVPVHLDGLISTVAWNRKHDPIGFTVILSVVTTSYVPLAKNFLCYIRALENPPNVLMWTVDNNGTSRIFLLFLLYYLSIGIPIFFWYFLNYFQLLSNLNLGDRELRNLMQDLHILRDNLQ